MFVGYWLGNAPTPPDHAVAEGNELAILVLDLFGREVGPSGVGLGKTFLDLAASSAGDESIDVGLLVDGRFRVGFFLERNTDEFVALGIETALEDADRLEKRLAGIELFLRKGCCGVGRLVVAWSSDVVGLTRTTGSGDRFGGGGRGDVVSVDGDRACGTQGDVAARVVASSATRCRHEGKPCNQRAHPARGLYRHPVLLERPQRSHGP